MTMTTTSRYRQYIALGLILLLGAALRWAALPNMTDMLGFDESYYAADAISLLDSPRLTPFFAGNNGRESGWMYLLAAFMWGMGKTAFTARLVASFVGILTIAAVYRLGKELFGTRIGIWSALAVTVLYWPVHFSHIAMRADLLPLLGALGLAIMLTAQRNNRMRCWIASGIVIGVTTYSYLSAQLWIALEILILLIWILTNRRLRRGALVAMLLALALSLPMVIYAIQHPAELLARAQQSATLGEGAFIGAIEAWVNAWFTRGDILLNHNIPGRPILDGPTGMLFIVGLLGLPWVTRQVWRIALVFALAIISIAPSLLSEFPPHFLRSIGLIVPIALVLGAGAETLTRLLSALFARLHLTQASPQSYAAVVPVGLLMAGSVITYRDFHEVWLNLPAISDQFQRPVHQAVKFIEQSKSALPAGSPIYFTPFELTHPVVQFSRPALSPHRLGAFASQNCLIVSTSPAIYINLPSKNSESRDALSSWGQVTTLTTSAVEVSGLPAFSVFQLEPSDETLYPGDDWIAQFGGVIEIRTSKPSPKPSPAAARPSEQLTLAWQMRMRALRPLDRPYSLFVHLYKVDSTGVIDDGRKWAQGDQQMCASYPTTIWQPDEVAVQAYNLNLPSDLPDGEYVIAVGVYDSGSGQRLNVTRSQSFDKSSSKSYAVLQDIRVNHSPLTAESLTREPQKPLR